MNLNYRFLPSGSGLPNLIILHGVFGSSENWLTVSKLLNTYFQIYLVDLRNHGKSPHSDTFTLPSMAEDVAQFITQHKIEKPIILGHSMGGKVTMFFAQMYPTIASKYIIVDIGPKYYPIHHATILDGLQRIKLGNLAGRTDAENQLAVYVPEKDVRQFLLKNLARNDNGEFIWRLNLPVIANQIENIGIALPASDTKITTETLFIAGADSHYIKPEDWAGIEDAFGNVQLVTIPNAGHWVQAQAPDAFAETVMNFCK